jgi:hypothetical protein
MPSTCVSDCVEDEPNIPEACRREVVAVSECFVNRPASDWECDADGYAGPKEGVCAAETTRALTCVLDSNEPCPFEEDDECDDPSGTNLCPAGTDLADCS